MRKYISIVFVGMLFLIPTVLAEPSASASRSIEHKNLNAGGSTHVTVTITSNLGQSLSLSLMETPPSGWTLVRVSDDAKEFKNGTNEWLWLKIDAGMTKTVVYRLDIPSNANPGTYSISGSITNASGIIGSVMGESTVNVITPGGGSTSGSTTSTVTPTATVKTSTVTPTAAVTSTPTPTASVTNTPVGTTAAPGFTTLITIAAVIGMIMLLLHRRRYK
ncbi:MAG: hypothetical protein O8C55_10405 [Candidatus Methanoperedens sp.]|nr:hypothetical protein [Candidatus Methanoperedens sp.]